MIFGKGYPVAEIVSSSTEIIMHYAGLIPKFKDKRKIENESPINGYRTWVDLWNHAEFLVRVYLFNHSDPIGFFNILAQMEDETVYFKPHQYRMNGITNLPYLKDADGENVEFKCTDFNPYYLNDINRFDVLEMTFKSNKPVVMETVTTGILRI